MRMYLGTQPLDKAIIGGNAGMLRVGFEKKDENILYELPSPVTFTGNTNEAIDTGVKLWEQDISFTIEMSLTLEPKSSEQYAFSIFSENFKGIKFGIHPTAATPSYYFVYVNGSYNNIKLTNLPLTYSGDCRVVITHAAGKLTYTIAYTIESGNYTHTITMPKAFSAKSTTLLLGCDYGFEPAKTRAWVGTIYTFKIIGGDPV